MGLRLFSKILTWIFKYSGKSVTEQQVLSNIKISSNKYLHIFNKMLIINDNNIPSVQSTALILPLY